jgi:hypothetical protein
MFNTTIHAIIESFCNITCVNTNYFTNKCKQTDQNSFEYLVRYANPPKHDLHRYYASISVHSVCLELGTFVHKGQSHCRPMVMTRFLSQNFQHKKNWQANVWKAVKYTLRLLAQHGSFYSLNLCVYALRVYASIYSIIYLYILSFKALG